MKITAKNILFMSLALGVAPKVFADQPKILWSCEARFEKLAYNKSFPGRFNLYVSELNENEEKYIGLKYSYKLDAGDGYQSFEYFLLNNQHNDNSFNNDYFEAALFSGGHPIFKLDKTVRMGNDFKSRKAFVIVNDPYFAKRLSFSNIGIIGAQPAGLEFDYLKCLPGKFEPGTILKHGE